MKDTAAPGPALEPAALAVLAAAPAAAPFADGPAELPASLPRDHPAWQRDVLAVSARVRAALAHVRPVAVRVLTFWDHVLRGVIVRGRRVEIDPSGCYRVR